MFVSIEGVYRDGKVELLELPMDAQNDDKVIVTFMNQGSVQLSSVGIDKLQAQDLRSRLTVFEEEWNNPEMDIYNHYEESKNQLKKG